MKTKNFIKFAQAFCFLAFAGFAMASTSSQSAVEHMDSFVDGYQEGRKYRSENDIKPENHESMPEVHEHFTTLDMTTACAHDSECDHHDAVKIRARCRPCNGTGKVDGRELCSNCDGNGCALCDWRGYNVVKVTCRECNGEGWISKN